MKQVFGLLLRTELISRTICVVSVHGLKQYNPRISYVAGALSRVLAGIGWVNSVILRAASATDVSDRLRGCVFAYLGAA